MDGLFILQLALSFGLGGLVVAVAITIAERLGPKTGAILLSLPTNSLVGFLFVALATSVPFVQATIPFSLIGLCVFIVSVSVFLSASGRWAPRKALLVSLGVWLALAAFVLGFLHSLDLSGALMLVIPSYVLANLYFGRLPSAPKEPGSDSRPIFLQRMLFAGSLIALVVFMAKTLGPAWGGLFTVFPVSTFSSYWLLGRDHSPAFMRALSARMLRLSGVFVAYTCAIYFLFPVLGIFGGTAAGFVIALVVAYGLDRTG